MCGTLMFLVYLVFMCTVSAYCTECFVFCAEKNNAPSFRRLALKLYGYKTSIIVQLFLYLFVKKYIVFFFFNARVCVCVCLFCQCVLHASVVATFQKKKNNNTQPKKKVWGVSVSYMTACKTLLATSVRILIGKIELKNENQSQNQWWDTDTNLLILCVFIIVLPLSLKRKISALRYTSMIGLIICAITCVIVMVLYLILAFLFAFCLLFVCFLFAFVCFCFVCLHWLCVCVCRLTKKTNTNK